MKLPRLLTLTFLLFTLYSFSNSNATGKPIMIEVQTNYKTIENAILACENILLEESFITENRSERTLTARRGGVKDGFYSANVVGTNNEYGVLIKITFIKKGLGFYSIKKLSIKIKKSLENTEKKEKQKIKINKNTSDKYDQLREVKKLLDEGILTQEEFKIEKKKILEKKE